MAVEAAHLLPSFYVPQPDSLIVAAGEDVTTVGREGDRSHTLRVARETVQFPTGGQVPQAHSFVRASRESPPPIGRNRHAIDLVRVPFKAADFPGGPCGLA